MMAPEISELDSEPPAAWVEEHGEAEARRLLRIAKDARLPNSEKPAYLDVAVKSYLGITKAISSRDEGGKAAPLQAKVLVVVQKSDRYPVQYVDVVEERKK